MNNLEELKKIEVAPRMSLHDYLMAKHPNGGWRVEGDIFIFAYQSPGYDKKTEYKWGIDEQGFYTISGKTEKLTPQFDRGGLVKNDADIRQIPFEKNVHDYWTELFEENDNEEEVTQQVADRFEISVEEVTEIYVKVQKFLVQ